MDAGAYLRRQGWRGDGHALSRSGNGIKKPLLISKKVDVLGVGLNKHAAVSDQWWMRAFDQGLKDLGTGKKGALSSVREKGMHFGGLYGRFVQGETVEGTIEERDANVLKRRRSDKGKESTRKRRRGSSSESVNAPKLDNKGVKQLRKDLISKPVDSIIAEAVRRGLLPPNPKKPMSTRILPPAQPEQVLAQIFGKAGLDAPADVTKLGKSAKVKREKSERTLKKVAKQYLLESLPVVQREQLEKAEKIPKQELLDGEVEKAAKFVRQGDVSTSTSDSESNGVAVQTAGDAALLRRSSVDGTSTISVVDDEGNVRWSGTNNTPVPLDPTIWEGIKSKSLPKPVREARRRYKHQSREARKNATASTKSRDQCKYAQREKFALWILQHSRKAHKSGAVAECVDIAGIKNVPLVHTLTKTGDFSPEEMVMAKRVARKVLKQQKSDDIAKEEKRDKKIKRMKT